MPVTGLLPRRPETRERMASEALFHVSSLTRETVIQHIAWIRDQRSKPSCVGQTFAAGVDAVLGHPPWCSAVDLWRDARRRQGNLEGVLDGTRAEYVIASLIKRGWSPYKPGEDSRPRSDDDNPKGSLADEMFAHDKRQIGVVNYDISRNRVASTIEALSQGYVVGGGWGLADKFFAAPPDIVLTPDYLTGRNGHEMRVVGYYEPRRAFILQNSWGRSWNWCETDEVMHGCCLITEEALDGAWDIDAVEIRV